jgi:hypothetical protein
MIPHPTPSAVAEVAGSVEQEANMATVIKVKCDWCGEQELGPSGVHLTVFDAGDGHYYEFFCPKCFELMRKPADEHVQVLLTSGNVASTYVHIPLEVLEVKGGPALTVDDLMDFVVDLRNHSDYALEAQAVVRDRQDV